jgi:hypothetical protein
MKIAPRNQSKFLPSLIIALSAASVQSTGLCQDYKPGDPINFGGAHKPMFQPKGSSSAPAMVPQAGTPAPDAGNAAAAGAPGGPPNNFLNTRSIPWRTGDPVTFGAAHKPYSPEDNKPPLSSPSTPVLPVAPVAQSLPLGGVPTAPQGAMPAYAAPASDGPQDLQARPGSVPQPSLGQSTNFSQAPTFSQPGAQPQTASHKQKPAKQPKPAKQSTPPVSANQANTAGGASNGNIFSHFWHFIFGSGSK